MKKIPNEASFISQVKSFHLPGIRECRRPDREAHTAVTGGPEKPRISILLAVYEPRLDWLRQQLESLNAQDYPDPMSLT